jgi:hypothetical protein
MESRHCQSATQPLPRQLGPILFRRYLAGRWLHRVRHRAISTGLVRKHNPLILRSMTRIPAILAPSNEPNCAPQLSEPSYPPS